MYVIGQNGYNQRMNEITITAARDRLSSLVDEARHAPVFLTRRDRTVAALVDAEQLHQLIEDTEELADIRAADEAWEEAERVGEAPIPWDDVKRDLGLT